MAKETKGNILDTARKLFAEKGFEGCSMDLIAARAKVNKATIYYHFKDKATLYENVLEDNLGRFLQRVEKAVAAQESPEEKLAAFASSYAANFTSNNAMAPLMLRELASDGAHLRGRPRTIIRNIIEIVDAILNEGRRKGIFRETKTFLPYFMIVGSMNIYTSTRKMRKQFKGDHDQFGFATEPDEAAAEITAIVLRGLKNKE